MNNEMMALICGLLMGIQALSVQKHFQKSHFGQASQIGEIDVDAYAICFNEDDLKEDRYNGLEFFIKLAIDPEEPLTAIVSFHLSGSP